MASGTFRIRRGTMGKFVVLILCIAAIGWTIFLEWDGLHHMHLLGYDYVFFYHAFQVMNQHRPEVLLYNLSSQHNLLAKLHYPIIRFNQYVYPPQFAVSLAPLAGLPFHVSRVLWEILSCGLYALAVFLNFKMFLPKISWTLGTIVVALLIISTPFQIDIGVGNVNSILFALITISFYLLYKSKRPWLAGLPLALAVLIKVTPAVIVLYLLMRKQWKTSLAAVMGIAVISLATAWQLGWGALVNYAQNFVSFGQTSEKHGPAPYNQSLQGVLGVLSQHHWLNLSPQMDSAIFFVFLLVVVLSTALVLNTNRNVNWKLDYAMASLAPLLLSPLVEEMHMVLAIPAILSLLVLPPDKRDGKSRTRSVRRYIPSFVALACLVILSLPMTFLLNDLTSRWPQLFLLHTQMFWVLLSVFATTLWRMRQPSWQAVSLTLLYGPSGTTVHKHRGA